MQRIFKALCIVFLFLPAIVLAASDEIRFLALADIHFDPFASCYDRKGPCKVFQALEKAPVEQWSQILQSSNEESQAIMKDTNYALLHYSLLKAKKVAEVNQVQFVIVLGDFLAHDYRFSFKKYSSHYSREGYHQFVKKTLMYLTQEFAQTFPGLPVYNVVGNNDSYTADYGYHPSSGFFSNTGSLWSSLIKNNQNKAAMQREFSSAGYYAVSVASGWKLIVLNTVLFSNKGIGRGIDEAATKELNWFQQALQDAKINKQKVLIAMHIPPGIDVYASLKFRLFRMVELWKLPDTERYEALLKEYAPEITGIFAGHLHHNLLQQLTISNENSVPIAGVPSISPYFGNKPGFNVYVFSNEGELEAVKNINYPVSEAMDSLK